LLFYYSFCYSLLFLLFLFHVQLVGNCLVIGTWQEAGAWRLPE
jgi:hypothetical protein